MHAETGQVVIMIRQMVVDENNPYAPGQVGELINTALSINGFTFGEDYDIIMVPNITNIGYGRDVGYTITQYDLGEDIHKMSATEIRNELKN